MRSRDVPYIIGDIPIFDPCKECLVKVVCTKLCIPKMMFMKGYRDPAKILASLKIRKKKK